ncbi:MAG: hypothetical protein ACTHZ5_01300 [Micrococcaceae bacterium]
MMEVDFDVNDPFVPWWRWMEKCVIGCDLTCDLYGILTFSGIMGCMTAMPSSSPGLDAYRDSVILHVPELVSGLRSMLGAKLTAYLGGVKETRAVRQWASGERVPSDAVVQRLRLAYQVAGLLLESQNSENIVQAWFQGMNPQLEDQSPARILREGDLDAMGSNVLSAARAFARIG